MRRHILLLLLSISINGFAQSNDLAFEHIIPIEALRQNYLTSITQDKKGYIWLGTYSSLFRYDGYNTASFAPNADTTSLSNPVIHCTFQDETQTIWFGTEGGINKYNSNTGKFTRFLSTSTKLALSHNHVKSICKDAEDNLWIGTYGGGINVYNTRTKSIKVYRNNKNDNTSLSSDRVNTILIDRNGSIWIGTELGGICKYNKKEDNFYRFTADKTSQSALSDNTVNSIFEDSKGQLWIGTWKGGLNLYNRETNGFRTFIYNPSSPKNINIRSITEDLTGNLWLGSFGNGLYHFNTTDYSYNQYTHDEKNNNTITSDNIWSVFVDKTGILWIGTAGDGINKYDSNRHKFPSYKLSAYDKMPVFSIFEDEKRNRWIGSKDGVLAQFNTTSNSFIIKIKDQFKSNITAIQEDRNKNLWLGTSSEGLIKYNPQTGGIKTFSTFKNSATTPVITALYKDANDNLWFALYDMGLFRIDASKLESGNLTEDMLVKYTNNSTDLSTVSSNIIWAINEDYNGNIWLATDKFIDKLDQKTNTFNHYGGFSYSCIYQNKPNIFWVGTYGRGLARFTLDNQQFEYFDKSNGLIDNLTNSITGDNNGNIWIATFKGLSKFNTLNNSFTNFDTSDGLQSDQFSHNSCFEFANGDIALGGSEGINIFRPGSIKITPENYTVILSDIKLYNKSIIDDSLKYLSAIGSVALSATNELKLNHSDNMVSIEFSALNFSIPDKQQYEYKLEGFDKNWILTNAKNRLATYTNLDDDTYLFRVRTINSDGTPSSFETTLKITIAPPYYKTWYFRLFMILVLLATIYLLYKRRVQHLHNQYQRIQAQNEQELIRLKHEKLDSDLNYKSKELTSRTLNLIHSNERIVALRNELENLLPTMQGENLKRMQSILRTLNTDIEDDSHWDQFEFHFNQTHDNFLQRFKEAHPSITHNDLKMCAYMRMSLQNHEIASLLNISIRSVETNRYRIRKKINLDTSVNLAEYILRF